MNKFKQILGLATAAAMTASCIPMLSVSAYEVYNTGATVTSIENRTPYYTLVDDSTGWTVSNTEVASYKKNGSVITFTNTNTGMSTLARYIDEAPATFTDNVLEAEFTVQFNATISESSFSIVGGSIKATGDQNENAILRLLCNAASSKVLIYDGQNPVDISGYGVGVNDKIKVHAVMNFTTKDTDLDVYTVDDVGTETFKVSIRDAAFYDSSMTTAMGLYLRTAKGSTAELSDVALYQQGEAQPTLTLYDLSSDINTSATADDTNQSNWPAKDLVGASLSTALTDEGKIDSLTLSGSDNHASRTATRTFGPSTKEQVSIAFDLDMTSDIDGVSNKTSENIFAITDGTNSVIEVRSGFDSLKNYYDITVNGTSIYEKIKNYCNIITRVTGNGTTVNAGVDIPTLSFSADVDFSAHTVEIKITDSANSIDVLNQTFAIDTSISSVSTSSMTIHRADGGQSPSTTVSNLVITQDNTYEPVITSKGVTQIETGKTVSIATVNLYDEVTVESSDERILTCVFLNTYSSIVAKGVNAGDATVTITAYNYNGGAAADYAYAKKVVLEIPIKVVEDTGLALNTVEEGSLNEISPAADLFTIDFDDNNTGYEYFDEYGRTHDETPPTWTKIKSSDELTAASSGISGNAFYSYLEPEKETQKGNGYRGSMLELDNSSIQRTDKIRVSYDFAFKNIVKEAGNPGDNKYAGVPFVITMTSEGEEDYSIPYNFNGLGFDEVDADPSDLTSISKHLLTFFTGRPKRDSDGVHWVDMTNTLAYYDPRYEEYVDLTMPLKANEFNYFHVEADIDFCNDIIRFTIDNTGDNAESVTKTTNIPENSSWNGFIISSNKWDNDVTENGVPDINGQDTEHYAYLDNIKATKTAEEIRYLNNAQTGPSVETPAQKDLPTDAVILTKTTTDNATWIANPVLDLQTALTAYDKEIEKTEESGFDFTYNVVTGAKDIRAEKNERLTYHDSDTMGNANGITSYTEFDFFLPKEGSKLTLYMTGKKSGAEVVGNTITIGTSGINSWFGNENYQGVMTSLNSGEWYSMQIVYDLNDIQMLIEVKDSKGTIVASKQVNARGLSGGFYRTIRFNPDTIYTGNNGLPETDEAFWAAPQKEPSMALTYVANLRIYNRATLVEYYKEGAVADPTNGDVTMTGVENANTNGRIGGEAVNFTRDQVNGGYDEAKLYTRTSGSYPAVPPTSADGRSFLGWKLIYSNGDKPTYPTTETVGGDVGTNATRIKYAAVYGDLPVNDDGKITGNNTSYYYKQFWTELPIISGNNYKTINWYVYNNGDFRMWGDFDMKDMHTTLTGDGASYRIGYVVYNIPTSIPEDHIVALPKAHYDAVNETTTLDTEQEEIQNQASSMEKPSGAPTPAPAN